MSSWLLTRADAEKKAMTDYPKDHQVGIEVPRGGSDCAKCEYLKDYLGRICGNKNFIAAECSKPPKPADSNKIPLPVDEYCCDFFEIPKPLDAGKNPLVQLKARSF